MVGGEELEEARADEVRRCPLSADDCHDVLAVEVPRLTEERLFALVVVVGAVLEVPRDPAVRPDRVLHSAHRHVLDVAERPPGEGARGLLDVVFGVVADAHGEELQQLPTVVLVNVTVVVLVVVEPQQHRRVLGKLDEDGVEPAQSVLSEHVDLVQEAPSLVELRVPRGEEAVEEQSDSLFQWVLGSNHAIEPVARRRVHLAKLRVVDVIPPDGVLRQVVGIAGVQKFLDGLLVAHRRSSFQLVRGAPNAARRIRCAMRSMSCLVVVVIASSQFGIVPYPHS